MTIGFRVDANEHIATGHLMRCIAIATQFIKKDVKCLFLLAENKETDRLQSRNIPYIILNSKWNDMEAEEQQLAEIIRQQKLDFLIVDSYQITASYLKFLNDIVPVMYIDDMELETYDITAVLRYGSWEGDDYINKYRQKGTKVLFGMSYTPLREEFALQPQDAARRKSILITTGGIDTYNVTGRLLQYALQQKDTSDYEYDVIVGSMNEHEPELKEIAKSNPQVKLHKNIPNIVDYMRECQLAVSAGGTTVFELCSCKIPTVCFSFADNQEESIKTMGQKKIMLYAGDARKTPDIEKSICQNLITFIKDSELREQYSRRMFELVDGRGAERIVEEILKITAVFAMF